MVKRQSKSSVGTQPSGLALDAPITFDSVPAELIAVLEAMLFASSEPLELEEFQAALPEVATNEIETGLRLLETELKEPERGLKLERIAGGWRLVTKPDLAASLRALFRFRNQKRLTPSTLDVLAIVAYSQPITAPEIEEIRGVDPSYGLRVLLDRKLIRMMGRKRVAGRPILYGTSREFLLHFGLDTLEDLPSVEGYGTRVRPSQARLFPVSEFEIEPLDLDDEAALLDEPQLGLSIPPQDLPESHPEV